MVSNSGRTHFYSSLVLVLVLGGMNSLFAQEVESGVEEVEQPVKKQRTRSRLLEEVVVTAQKREENVQDVPISIQAFSAQVLDARGIVDQRDLQFITPTLEIGTQISYTTIYLRGVGTDAFLTADPSVATYIDGIYFPFAQGLAQDFGAVERIEVLKGPQGTLFGRNATGGALNIISKDPDFDEFYFELQSSFANYPDQHSRIHINVPVSETAAFSMSVIKAETDYFVEGTVNNGDPLEPLEDEGVRSKFRWAPYDWVDLTLSHFYITKKGTGGNFTLNRFATDLLLTLDPGQDRRPNGNYEGSLSGATYNNLENEVFYGQVAFFTPLFDIKILGSDQYVNTQGLFDFDGSDSSLVSFEPEKNYSDVQTAEIQFLSNGEGLTTSWMQWIAGLYYFEGISGFDPIIGIVDSLTFLDEILSQIPDLGVGIPTGDIYIEGVVATESEAAFLQTTFNVFEWLDLTLGLRYQVEKRNIVKGRMGLRDTNGDVTILQDYGYATTQEGVQVSPSDKTSSLSPKVSIDLRPFDEDTLIYLSYQEATKSATFNATVVTAPPTYAAPETLTAWELGIKTKLFDRMTLSAAMFKYDIDDLQVQFLALLNGGVVSFENARSAKIRGMDFDMTLEPSPDYLPGLTLTGGAGWLKDAEYNSYPNGAGFQGNSGQFSRNNDFTGNRIVRSAEYTASFSLSQTVDIVGGPLEMSVDYYYNDGFFYEASNNPRSQQDRYETYGARVSYLLEDQNLRLTLFGKNLKDKVFSTGNVPNDFGSLPTINPEATFGLRINWQFFGGES